MEPPKTLKVEIPEIRASVLKREDDDRKGAGAGLLSKLGLGGGSGGGAGGFAAGGGLLAGKAGIVALIVAGSSVAAGVGLLTLSNNNGGVLHPAGVFAKADGPAPSDSAQAASNSAGAPDNGVASSLDNFHQANRGAVPDPYAPAAQQPEQVKDAAGPAQVAGAASAVPDNTTTQSPGTTPPSAGAHPKMVKGQGFGGSSSSAGGGSSASGGGLVAAGERPGSTANFAHSAPGGTSAMRAERGVTGAQRRSAVSNGFNGASSQLAAHSNTLRSNLGSGAVSSMGSGAVMDGSLASGSIGGHGSQISGGGAGTGGKGIDSSPGSNMSNSLRQVSPPPPPVDNKGKNQTSYQKQMMMAIGAMLGAMALLYFSGMYSDKAKTASLTPVEKAADIHIARNLAAMATALAAVATGIGLWLMNQQGQMMQGLMLTGIGGILTFQAGKAWMQGMSAAKQADAQVTADAQASANNMNAKLVDGSVNTGSGTFQATPQGATQPSTYNIQYTGGTGAGAPAPSVPTASANLAPAKLVPPPTAPPVIVPPS